MQKTEEDDSIFAITYVGEHTCIDRSRDENVAGDDNGEYKEAPPPCVTRQECEEEAISNNSTTSSSTLHRPLFVDLGQLTTEGSSPASLMAYSVSGHGAALGMELASEVFKLEDWLASNKDE